MREELEAIWNNNEIANASYITGWLEEKSIGDIKGKRKRISRRFSNVLVAIRCRKVTLKLKSRVAAIRKHQRLY